MNRLLQDEALRQRLGAAGRAGVEQRYCLAVAAAPRLVALLKAAASKGEAGG